MKKMKNVEFRKFESFEELKSSKSENSERTEEQILKSHRDFEIFIEELRKNIVPNEV